jgi:hypothetical protein
MWKGLRQIAVAAIVLAIAAVPATGQEAQGNVVINSNPQGAPVILKGDVTLSGVTPIRFSHVLSGEYEVIVKRDGYESYKSVEYFSASKEANITVDLVPKTSVKAAMRSMLIPGWGQSYYGSKFKSVFFFVGTIASATTFYFVNDHFDSKRDEWQELKDQRAETVDFDERRRLEESIRDAQETANDAENWNNIMIGVTAGIYALNVIDNILFFPEHSSFAEYKALTVTPEMDKDRVTLAVSLSF